MYGTDGRRLAKEAWQVALENHTLMTGIMKKYDIQCDYYNHGSYIVAMKNPDTGSHPEPMSLITESYHLMQEDGFDVDLIDEQTLQDLKRSPMVSGAIWNKFDGELHPVKYVRGMAAAAKGIGAQIFENTPIIEIKRNQKGLIVHTPNGRIRTKHVLLGMNAYTPQLDESFEERIIPHRGQVFTTEPASERLFNGGRNHHVKAEQGFHFLRRNKKIIKTYRGYKERPTRAVQRSNDIAFNRIFPHLADLKRSHRWGGVMGFSYDSSPFVGETETPGVFLIAGFTGRGNAYATIAARMLGDKLLGRPSDVEERFEMVRTVFDPMRGRDGVENRRQ